MVQQLRALAAPPQDPALTPSNHVWLRTSSGAAGALWPQQAPSTHVVPRRNSGTTLIKSLNEILVRTLKTWAVH